MSSGIANLRHRHGLCVLFLAIVGDNVVRARVSPCNWHISIQSCSQAISDTSVDCSDKVSSMKVRYALIGFGCNHNLISIDLDSGRLQESGF